MLNDTEAIRQALFKPFAADRPKGGAALTELEST